MSLIAFSLTQESSNSCFSQEMIGILTIISFSACLFSSDSRDWDPVNFDSDLVPDFFSSAFDVLLDSGSARLSADRCP